MAAPPTDAPALAVTLVHDLVCPWCRIGNAHLKQALAAWGRPAVVAYRPFLLEPDAPPEGFDLRQRLGAKYGVTRLDTMFERVAAAGRAAGLTFDFARVRVHPDAVPGHALLDAAPAEHAGALLDALHAAYFERGEDIGQRDVLVAVAAPLGLDAAQVDAALADAPRRARVRADAAAASRAGITGVPFVVLGGRVALHGAQPPAVFLEALRELDA